MPTRVDPNCSDIFQEEVDFKSPISEAMLTKFAANINAACESLTPTCTHITAAGAGTYQALPGSKFIMLFGVGGGGGGGGLRTDILDHNSGTGSLSSGTAPSAGFENGEPGGATTFNGQVVGSGGRGGGSALAYVIADRTNNQNRAHVQYWNGLGFGRKQVATDNDGFSPWDELILLTQGFSFNTVLLRKWLDPRASFLGEDGRYVSHAIAGAGGLGGNYTSAITFADNATTTGIGAVRLLGGGGQAGKYGVCEVKSIPNAVYSYVVGAGGDNGGATFAGGDTIATNLFIVNNTGTTTSNAVDGSPGALLIVDWGHS